ncbi:MAG: M48 family metalloprotease [Pseudohongiellaceae bacterium]
MRTKAKARARHTNPLLAALLCVMLLPLLSSCAVNPATGTPNLVTMSEKREMEIGKEEHDKIMTNTRVVEDEELTAYVTEVGNRMAATSHRPDLKFQFFVIDDPAINAFALPGGYAYVNRGLLAYLNSEAELAAVLGHEISHITARHAVQQQSKGALSRVAAQVGGFVAAVATGSNYIGSQISQVGSLWAQVGLSGFGREQELEADRLGAEYLIKAGYDPQAMIEVITVLKNQKDYMRRVTGGGGGYHGVFATHPRTDTRLQEAIASVGELPAGQPAVDNSRFRDVMDGLVFGQSAGSKVKDERNRYYQTLLGYTMVFPNDWQLDETTTTVAASDPAVGSLRVEVQRIQDNIEPRLFIRDKLGISNLQKTEVLEQYRLLGHTGMTTAQGSGNPMRVAAIYFGPRVYTFYGEILDPTQEDAIDAQLLNAIRSFRAIQHGELQAATERHLKWVQADANFDFAAAAQNSPMVNFGEETLRLLNGYYPSGQPEPGEWIKLVE